MSNLFYMYRIDISFFHFIYEVWYGILIQYSLNIVWNHTTRRVLNEERIVAPDNFVYKVYKFCVQSNWNLFGRIKSNPYKIDLKIDAEKLTSEFCVY